MNFITSNAAFFPPPTLFRARHPFWSFITDYWHGQGHFKRAGRAFNSRERSAINDDYCITLGTIGIDDIEHSAPSSLPPPLLLLSYLLWLPAATNASGRIDSRREMKPPTDPHPTGRRISASLSKVSNMPAREVEEEVVGSLVGRRRTVLREE